jgi:regulator of PEP synthase PpsR (kinase-PPPase family)
VNRSVFFVSDSTGITAETLGHALLAQFDNIDYGQVTVPFVDTPEKAEQAVSRIGTAALSDGHRPIVFSTLTDTSLLRVLERSNALVLDLFSVFLRPLELELNRGSAHVTGRFHGQVDRASYQARIEAVEFALKHDDGASVRHYGDADVVLVGVSRSGKTPTCVYLSMHFGVRAANYPITDEDLEIGELPGVLAPHGERLYGLTIGPERLHQIRTERRPNSQYASIARCRREVRQVEDMFRGAGVAFLDTSAISVEEIATRVMQATGLRRRIV